MKDYVKNIFFKNKFTAGFSISAAVILLVFILNILGANLGNRIVNAAIYTYSPVMLLLLFVALTGSAVLAYYKKYSWMILPLLAWLLISTAAIRTANIPGLKDITTDDWTLGPDLDPFLYLRLAGDIENGTLENPDIVRNAPLGTENYAYSSLMPWAIVVVHKIISIFGQDSLNFAAIIAPVIFFILSMLLFFLFCYFLFSLKFSKMRSLFGAFICAAIYSVIPQMLHRTVAGIPEIESLGMVWFWAALLFFILAWKKSEIKSFILFGVLAGIFTGLMTWTWGGYRYLFMAITFSSLLAFFVEKEHKKNFIIFSSWFIPSLIITYLKIRSLKAILFTITDSGFASGFFIILLIYLAIFHTKITFFKKIQERLKISQPIFTILLLMCILIILLLLSNPSSVLSFFGKAINTFLHPFGANRIGSTVAENRVPYFSETIDNFGYLFWLSLIGSIALFYEAIKHFKVKHKIYLLVSFIVFLFGLSFSRLSPTSLLNGDNFLSQLLFIGSLGLFAIVFIGIYIRAFATKDIQTLDSFKNINFFLIFSLSFILLGSLFTRIAIRFFFLAAPIFIISSVSLFLFLTTRNKRKETRVISWGAFAIVAIILFGVFINYAQSTKYSAQTVVPGEYEFQWQKAMSWVRENTPQESIFVHWWDYGYWVQTIGERATVTDGGHANDFWNHLIGRYLLTTNNPDSALSLMKTLNASYLLIDSTDIGKYSAYSLIGSDKSGEDRASWIPVMPSDPQQSIEKANSSIKVFSAGVYTDMDIMYDLEGKIILLPKGKTIFAGVIMEITNGPSLSISSPPQAVFFYNNQRYTLPVKTLFYGGRMVHFSEGINATVMIFPGVVSRENGVEIDMFGAAAYLSEKTQNSLIAKLYLMGDPENQYPTLKLAYVEDASIIKTIKKQVPHLGNFVYYGGLVGPIKIWKTEYPENIQKRQEFLQNIDPEEGWGELDSLQFTK